MKSIRSLFAATLFATALPALDVSGSLPVEVRVGPAPSLVVEADGNLLPLKDRQPKPIVYYTNAEYVKAALPGAAEVERQPVQAQHRVRRG